MSQNTTDEELMAETALMKQIKQLDEAIKSHKAVRHLKFAAAFVCTSLGLAIMPTFQAAEEKFGLTPAFTPVCIVLAIYYLEAGLEFYKKYQASPASDKTREALKQYKDKLLIDYVKQKYNQQGSFLKTTSQQKNDTQNNNDNNPKHPKGGKGSFGKK